MIFVDSGAWFAYLVSVDPHHSSAVDWMADNVVPLLTTDYVIDETLTLLRARGQNRKAILFGNRIFSGDAATVHFVSPEEIVKAWEVFRRFADKDWSFTDCTSKVILDDLSIETAFSFDQHFRQFGTTAVVP